MKDLYIIAVAILVAVHFAYIGYLLIGGFLALRWPATIFAHVPVVVWGFGSTAMHLPCPLTSAERWARAHAGLGPLPPPGFIDHYITGVWYPADAVGIPCRLSF
jgi:hypothetical protein